MVEAAGAGGSIRVRPESLHGLAARLREHASRAGSLAGDISGKTQVSLRQAELQASLEAFNRTWGRAAFGAASAGDSVASAVDAAAASYQRTEDDLAALLQPGDSPTDTDTPVPASTRGYVGDLTGRPGGDLGQLLDPGHDTGGMAATPASASDYIGGLAAGSNDMAERPSGDLDQLLDPGSDTGEAEAAPDSSGDYIGGLAAGGEGADHGSSQAAPGRPTAPEADD